MTTQGPGKIWVKDPEMANRSWGGPILLKLRVHLYNFDIDVPKLKEQHKSFLNEKVIPALTANRAARVNLMGSASRSGEHDHNKSLSGARASAVLDYLSANGAGPQVLLSMALGDPATGPKEDEHDRAAFLLIDLPIVIDDVSIRTDDWTRELEWDDIVGLGGTDKKSIQNINIEVKASGAPRVWNLDGGKTVPLMPDPFPFEAVGRRSMAWIPRNAWRIPAAKAIVQPANPSQTIYRLSDSVDGMGFYSQSSSLGVAEIARATVEISLKMGRANWDSRGIAVQGIPTSVSGRPDAKRLLEAGGVEVLNLSSNNPQYWLLKWLIRSPADVFFYSGNGTKLGCLSWVGDCWAPPELVFRQWRNVSDIKVLILGAPHVLKMNITKTFASGGPGARWGTLLKNKRQGGPLLAILGYQDDSPDIKTVGKEIAEKMGEKIAAGLKEDEWVQAWLKINGDHPGKNTWNAVGMDHNGYWWIEGRSAWSQSFDTVPFISGDKYRIKGPAVMT
jgi:hypothetical protein